MPGRVPYLKAMIRRHALRDDLWERIKDLLPVCEGHVGMTARDNRLFVESVLYRNRAGILWRDLLEALWQLSGGASSPLALEPNGCLATRLRSSGAGCRVQTMNTALN